MSNFCHNLSKVTPQVLRNWSKLITPQDSFITSKCLITKVQQEVGFIQFALYKVQLYHTIVQKLIHL